MILSATVKRSRSPKKCRPPFPRDSKAEAYGKHLTDYQWTFFGTLTTNYELSLRNCRTLADRFYAALSKNFTVSFFWIAEEFEARDGCHLHVLFKLHDTIPLTEFRKTCKEIWRGVSGNKEDNHKHRVDLRYYSANYRGAFYLSHKLNKPMVDYDYLGFEHFGAITCNPTIAAIPQIMNN